MANVINFNDDDKNKNQQQGNQAVSDAIVPPTSSAPPPPTQSSAPNKPASSGQFTNIQQYLKANTGAGEQISGNVQQKIQKNLQPGMTQQASDADKFKSGVQQANQTFGRGNEYLNQLGAPAQSAPPQQPTQQAQQMPTAPAGNDLSTGGTIQNSGALSYDQATNPANNPQQTPMSQQQFDTQKASFQTGLPEFLANQAKLTDYTKIRTGQGIDENALKNQANQSQLQAGLNQQQATDLFGRTKSASGRQGLLSETFNAPNYTQGQQRLDNLFLTGAGQKGINALQQGAKSNVDAAGNTYNKATQDVGSLAGISQQNKDLQSGLQSKANALESGYVKNLESLVPEMNNMRGAERDKWQKNFDILTGKAQGTVDPDIYNELQLRTGEHSFNVLNNPDLNLRQIAQVSDRNAANAQDVSNQGDVDYYKKLAQLSKGNVDANGNFVGPSNDQLTLNKASDLGRAVQSNTGENSLRGMLDTAQSEFLDKALKTNVTGRGSDSGSSGLLGGGSDANAQFQMNLAKYLSGNGVGASSIMNNPRIGIGDQAHALTDQYGFASNLSDEAANLTGSVLPGMENLNLSHLAQMGLDATNGLTGANSGSQSAADFRAKNDLISQLTATLKNTGYNNYVTTTGNKNVDEMANRQRDIDQGRFESQHSNAFGNQTPEQINQYAQATVGNFLAPGAQGTEDTRAYNSGVLNSGLTLADVNRMAETGDPKFQQLQEQQGGRDPREVFASAQRYQDALDRSRSNATAQIGSARQEYDNQMNTRDQQAQDNLNRARQFTGINNLLMPSLNYQPNTVSKLPEGK